MWFKRIQEAFSRVGRNAVDTAKAFDDLFNIYKGDDKKMFDFEKYKGRDYLIHVSSKDEFDDFIEVLNSHCDRVVINYVNNKTDGYYYYSTCKSISPGSILPDLITEVFETSVITIHRQTILEWSDFMDKKIFTKADLKNGDVIKRRNGNVGIVCVDTGTIIVGRGWDSLDEINPDLTFKPSSSGQSDIVKVLRPTKPSDCQFDAFSCNLGTLVYDRERDDPEVEEMTMDDVCKALGKRVKIVDRK